MTPERFLEIKAEQEAIIEAAKKVISRAYAKASRSKPPLSKLRSAEADDIVPGAVIWYEPDRNDSQSWEWEVVAQPLHYGDDFKAYVSETGCRHGLLGAWVSNAKR